jgi:hypothetical protein
MRWSRILVLALSLATACGSSDCPKPGGGGGVCPAPAPAPAPGPINVGGILTGFGGGGTGNGAFTLPGLGDLNVSLDCGPVTVQANKPAAGQTQSDMTCSFSKLGVSGSVKITIVMDKDGKGSISANGNASFFGVTSKPINAYIELTGGSQTGNTVTVNGTANGQCLTATITRDGDKITIEVSNPKTKIEINKK